MIEVRKISKIYNMGRVQALREVSVDIAEGEFVAIMGASGSGKSTLLSILGFLDKPDAGIYRFMGKDVTDLTDDELAVLRNNIAGFIFQQFHLLPRITALENAELPLVYAGKRNMKESVKQKIESVGLAHRETHYPNQLSGGEQQRVAIARSIANDPMIIFADEPTGNLDTKSEEEIISILKKLNDSGKTIVMVTHELEIAKHAKRIIRMRDGEIISDEWKNRKKNKLPKIVSRGIDSIFDKAHSYFASAEFTDYMKQAIGTVLSHKMRSLLSMLGILIGVAAVISMMALGTGAKEAVSESLSSLGTNLLMVRPGSIHTRGVALQAGQVTRFTMQDANAIAQMKKVLRVSPNAAGRAQLVYNNKNWNTQVQGVGSEYTKMKSAFPTYGRFFTEAELKQRSMVALVGTTVARELFGSTNPVGKTLKINKKNFNIIGILPSKGASFFADQDDIVVIPVTTAMYRLLGKVYVDSIDVEIRDPLLIEGAIDDISNLVIKRHRLNKDNQDSFQIRDMAELREALLNTTKTMSWLLGSVAAISLIVGGIGIMNIMLVSVKERTREIGLRKAIGARRIDILVQFLIESALMTFAGGIVGIMLGSGISILLSTAAGWAVIISPYSISISTVFSILVGIFFGLWPAIQASRLNPIEALRWE